MVCTCFTSSKEKDIQNTVSVTLTQLLPSSLSPFYFTFIYALPPSSFLSPSLSPSHPPSLPPSLSLALSLPPFPPNSQCRISSVMNKTSVWRVTKSTSRGTLLLATSERQLRYTRRRRNCRILHLVLVYRSTVESTYMRVCFMLILEGSLHVHL